MTSFELSFLGIKLRSSPFYISNPVRRTDSSCKILYKQQSLKDEFDVVNVCNKIVRYTWATLSAFAYKRPAFDYGTDWITLSKYKVHLTALFTDTLTQISTIYKVRHSTSRTVTNSFTLRARNKISNLDLDIIYIYYPFFSLKSTFCIIIKSKCAVRPDSHDVPNGHVSSYEGYQAHNTIDQNSDGPLAQGITCIPPVGNQHKLENNKIFILEDASKTVEHLMVKCKVNVVRSLVRNLFCYSNPTGFFNCIFVMAMSRINNRTVAN
uniref:Uncharacterized protein n=1 Tax=Hyaloperonospora arabidopsidis (strain Emoy2) TaxID=559515 RepID=M4B439_HYAAE